MSRYELRDGERERKSEEEECGRGEKERNLNEGDRGKERMKEEKSLSKDAI